MVSREEIVDRTATLVESGKDANKKGEWTGGNFWNLDTLWTIHEDCAGILQSSDAHFVFFMLIYFCDPSNTASNNYYFHHYVESCVVF